MYKLVLCLRYLRRRAIAYFAVLGVALCVAMILIVTSVMTGFVNKIERAARGLFGDIVLEPYGQSGLPRYDDLIEEIVAKVDSVEAASPRIYSYGVLRIPGQADFRMLVQIAGIRLPEATGVTDFAHGLFVQEGVAEPTFDPLRELMIRRVSDEIEAINAIGTRERNGLDNVELSDAALDLLSRLNNARLYLEAGLSNLKLADEKAAALEYLLDAQNEVELADGDTGVLADNLVELDSRLRELDRSSDQYEVISRARRAMGLAIALGDAARLNDPIDQFEAETIEPWPHRVIPGLGIDALSFNMKTGERVRVVGPGSKITLYVFPVGRGMSLTDLSPNVQRLTIVDDCTTDVASIDNKTVYLPFEELQRLNDMGEQSYEGGLVGPARCSQIQIKVRPDVTSEVELQKVCDDIETVWREFKGNYADRYPNDYPHALLMTAEAQTWRERQIDLISMIETQRTLMVVMFGIISLVSVVLVFVIFYMIVVQKTRDIGVLKAVGASSPGVAGIFLAYGAVIGLVGSIIGTTGGYCFVRNINSIQDWLDDRLGFRVWTRDRFMFAEIPNEVDLLTVLIIIVGAVIAGVLGAVVPAIRAARMQPVEALRYE